MIMARLATLAFVLTLILPAGALAAPGDPDRGFGRGGVATVTHGDLGLASPSIAVQPSGRIVASANLDNGSEYEGGLLQALGPSGRVDGSFGDRGRRLEPSSHSGVVAMADGRIVLSRFEPVDYAVGRLQLTRLTRDGTPDPSFGQGGTVTIATPNATALVAVARDSGIVLAFSTSAPTADGSYWGTVTVMRLAADGSRDLGFGTNGQVVVSATAGTVPDPIQLSADSLGIQPSGGIVVASEYRPEPLTGAQHLVLFRLSAAGKRDRLFGNTGRGLLDVREAHLQPGWRLAIGPGGELVLAGNTYDERRDTGYAIVRRLPQDGVFEGTRVVLDGSSQMVVTTLALDRRGAALLGGERSGGEPQRFAVARVTAKGLDSTFGHRGLASRDLGNGAGTEAIAIQPDGRVLLAGGGERLRVLRFWGGYDHRPPAMRLRSSCRGATARLTIVVRDGSPLAQLAVRTGKRTLRKTSAKRLRLAVTSRQRLKVRVVDGSGNERVRRLRAPVCP